MGVHWIASEKFKFKTRLIILIDDFSEDVNLDQGNLRFNAILTMRKFTEVIWVVSEKSNFEFTYISSIRDFPKGVVFFYSNRRLRYLLFQQYRYLRMSYEPFLTNELKRLECLYSLYPIEKLKHSVFPSK